MANFQERYGREGDPSPVMIDEISILGRRSVKGAVKELLPPHSLKDLQIIFVIHGDLEIWVDGQVHNVKKEEFIIVRPYEVMSYTLGKILPGERYFIQLNPHANSSQIYKRLMASLNDKSQRIYAHDKATLLYLDLLLSEHRDQKLHFQENCRSLSTSLYIQLIRLLDKKTSAANHGEKIQWLEQVYKLIEQHIQSSLTINYLAKEVGISENQFRLKFKELNGTSPKDYINSELIKKAKELLCDERKSITEVALELGFSSSQYFSLFFKKQSSFTPFEFRSAMRTLMHSSRPEIVSSKEAAASLDALFKLQKI